MSSGSMNSEEIRLDQQQDAGQRRYSYTRTRLVVLDLRLHTAANHPILGVNMHGVMRLISEFEAIVNYGTQHVFKTYEVSALMITFT